MEHRKITRQNRRPMLLLAPLPLPLSLLLLLLLHCFCQDSEKKERFLDKKNETNSAFLLKNQNTDKSGETGRPGHQFVGHGPRKNTIPRSGRWMRCFASGCVLLAERAKWHKEYGDRVNDFSGA